MSLSSRKGENYVKHVDLTQGKVATSLLKLSLPIIATSLLQMSYNFIDMLLVGRLGSEAVASIGLVSFLMGMVQSIQTMVIVGTGIVVAHAIGSKDEKRQHQNINAGFRLSLGFGILLSLAMLLMGPAYFTFMDIGNPYVENLANAYLRASVPGLFFTFLNLWYARVYNSFGLNKKAFNISAAGFIINIILAPILIYGLSWGVVGAGLSTFGANLVMSGLFFFDSRKLFSLDLKMPIQRSTYYKVLRLGFPISIQRVLFSVVNIILGSMITSFGAEAIAAQKIGLQIESITYLVGFSLNNAAASFSGQNYGGGHYNRIKEGVRVTISMGSLYAILTSAILLAFPETLARFFVDEPQTVEITANYLRFMGATQIFMMVEIIYNGVFVGLGLPKIPAINSIIFTVVRVPLAMLFISWLGVNGIWLSISISMFFKGCTATVIYLYRVKPKRLT